MILLKSKLTNCALLLLAVVLTPAIPSAGLAAQDKKPATKKPAAGPQRWAKAIAAFEKQDQTQPPPRGGILFVGSSSIRMWDLGKWFPQHDAINRGFGGSQIADSIHYADQLVLKHKPRIVVLYAGDNDIAAGKSPETVATDYRTFVKRLRAELPEVKIIFVAIKPSLRRWNLIGPMRQANALIRGQTEKDPRQVYLDIETPMLGPDGKPSQELFVKDGLHLSQKGYALWSGYLRSDLETDDWTQFRGSYVANTLSRRVPVDWDEASGQNITWKTAIHGRGWSSPVVFGSKIWLTTASEDGKRMSALCLDKASGKIVHDILLFENEKPRFCHAMNSYASPTPAIEKGRVYVHFGSYGTACLDSDSGKVLWRRTDLPCDHFRGPASSPLLFRDRLFVHFDGFDVQYVVALNKATGKTIWKVDRKVDYQSDNGDIMKAYATPIVVSIEGRLQLISPTSKAVLAYDPFSGEEIWRVRYKGFSATAQPSFGNGHLYINTGFPKAELYAVKAGGKGDITDTHVSWILRRGVPSKPTQLLVGNLIYMVDDKGIASCVDVQSGEIIWTKRLGGQYSSSPLLASDKIYLFSHEGKVNVLNMGREFEQVAEFQLSSGVMASPAVSGTALILRTKTHLLRIEEEP